MPRIHELKTKTYSCIRGKKNRPRMHEWVYENKLILIENKQDSFMLFKTEDYKISADV